MEFRIKVNATYYSVDTDPRKPLLWVLREDIGLYGAKYSCGIGLCGTCAVLLNGKVVRSCRIPIRLVGEQEVRTIEGLNDELGRAIKETWIIERVSQCGYCQPGVIIEAYALLRDNPAPSEDEIEAGIESLCRCGTYQRIRSAIRRVSSNKEGAWS